MKSVKKMRIGLVLTAILLFLSAGWMTWDHFDYRIPGIGAAVFDDPFAPPPDPWPEPIEPIRQKLRSFRRDLVESKNLRYQKRNLEQLSLDGTRWKYTVGNFVTTPEKGEILFFKNGTVKVTGNPIHPDLDPDQPTTYERLSLFLLLVKSGEKESQFELNVRRWNEDHQFDLILINHDAGAFIFLKSAGDATEADKTTATE